jgi:hypothetical protein
MKSMLLIGGALVVALPSLTFARPPAAPSVSMEGQAQPGGQTRQIREMNTSAPFRMQGATVNQTEGSADYGGVAETGQQQGSRSTSQSIHSLFAHH